MNTLTQQGIAALKAGNKAEARRLLKQALQQDPKDVQAWLCLSGSVEGDADIAYCLNMVLRLDPNNRAAREGLARFSQARSSAAAALSPSEPEPPAQPDFRAQLLHTPPFQEEPPEKEATTPPAPVIPVNRSTLEERPAARVTPARKSPQAAPGRKTGKPRRKAAKKSGFQPWMWIALSGMGLMIFLVLVAFAMILTNSPSPDRVSPAAIDRSSEPVSQQPASPSATPTAGLPPTSTSGPTDSPTQRPTRTPTPTATFIVPGPLVEKQMASIREQVSSLRGLTAQNDVPDYLVTKNQAADLLGSLYINDDARASLENEKRSLVILGLIQPDYDLVHVALNQFVDNIGGFYLPDQKQMYVLGVLHFGGIERSVYSHEFDHAIVDQSYDFQKIQDCPADSQRCEAVRALIEGDATLLMNQWVKQYATKEDSADLLTYHPPALGLSPDVPPAYLVQEMNFPYDQGLKFVTYLYKRGKWAAVNDAYANLPSSTEQILHPEKYIAGEGPIPVFAPAVEKALGGDWQIIANSSLGEWSTSLLLSSGADEAARIDANAAAKAAAGWGGDHYQVYYSPSLNKSASAVWWAWDNEKEGQQFKDALEKHLSLLYGGSTKDQPGADCWENNGQTTCVIIRPGQTLWLTAPDLPTIMTMWGTYGDFQ